MTESEMRAEVTRRFGSRSEAIVAEALKLHPSAKPIELVTPRAFKASNAASTSSQAKNSAASNRTVEQTAICCLTCPGVEP